MSDHPRLTYDRIDEIIGRDGAGARTDETLYLARELQERRASALPAMGDDERMRNVAKKIRLDALGRHPVTDWAQGFKEAMLEMALWIEEAASAAPSGDGRDGGVK